jgi:hypothetical protein
MEGAVFDIFSGAPRDNPIWLESAIGLSNARERMEEIATEIQGRYFLSSIGTHSPIAEIDRPEFLYQF